MGEWKDILVSTLPGLCDTQYGPVIVYNNKIYAIMTNDGYNPTIYSWNGISWNQEIALPEPPYYFTYSSSVVYNNKIHYLVGDSTPSSNDTYHFILDNGNWIQESSLPYNPYSGSAVIYNNKIHLLGGSKDLQSQEIKYYNDKKHYSWDGTNWIEESTLPYSFTHGNAVVYNNKIHILGCADYQDLTLQHHYSWDGNEWTQETDLPYFFQFGGATVYNNKIHIFGGVNRKDHYTYDGNSWTQETDLPYNLDTGFVVIYNNDINILNGLKHSTQDPEDIHYLIYEEGTKAVNKVIYGDETIIDISHDTVTSDSLVTGSTAHDKGGRLIVGTRPSFYKYCSNNFEYINDNFPIEFNPNLQINNIPVIKLGNYIINLRFNATSNSIDLYTIKEDGETESSVTLLSNASSNMKNFKIEKVWYISKNFCVIQYRYLNTSDLWTVQNVRGICAKFDGTLVLGATISNIGTADTITSRTELTMMPTLFGEKSFECISCRKIINTSNQKGIGSYRVYATNGTVSYRSTAENSVAANVAAYFPDFSLAASKGGYFYKNNGGVEYMLLLNSYGDVTKNIALSNVGSEIAAVGVKDHFILGYTTLGYLLTVKKNDKYYLWDYDQTNTTNLIKPIANSDASNFGAWNEKSTLPYNFTKGQAVVYNNKIHILGSNDNLYYKSHYSWDGINWISESILPIDFNDGQAVVWNNKIHIFKKNTETSNFEHYSWDGNSWTFEQQSVTGGDSRGGVHRGTVQDYVMQPNQDSVNSAKAKMKGIMFES